MIQRYIAADPLRAMREAARTQLAVRDDPSGGVLHVIHHHGGGTESHVRQLIDASRGVRRHYLAVAVGDAWQVEEHRADGDVVRYALERGAAESWPGFVGGICATFGIGLIHLHNISACRDGLLQAMAATPLPFGYTVHDVNFGCPTITFLDASGHYCGAVTDPETCRRCLAATTRLRGHRHRRLARAPPRTGVACRVPDRAVGLGRRHVRALLRAQAGGDRPWQHATSGRRATAAAAIAARWREGRRGSRRSRPGQGRAPPRAAGRVRAVAQGDLSGLC